MHHGVMGRYHWLTSSGHYLNHLVQLCPDVITGRFVAITSRGGRVPWLTEAQRVSGWKLESGIAYSGQIASALVLLHETHGTEESGFDEWYVFDRPPGKLGKVLAEIASPIGDKQVTVFVNQPGFALHHAAGDLLEQFRAQLDRLEPDLYVSDGQDCLTVACRHQDRFELIHQRLAAAGH